jgi:hypothetical protein
MRWRRTTRDDTGLAVLWLGTAFLALALKPVWLLAARLSPPCLLHEWTGLPCPTCGTTRSAVSLLHGDLAGAVGWNPLAAAAAGVFLAGGVLVPLWILCARKVPEVGLGAPVWLRWTAVAALLANWVYLAARGV